METVFDETHVGQEVHSCICGNGFITGYTSGSYGTYISCDFEGFKTRYLLDGREHTHDKYPSLSFGHKPDIIFDYGEPKRTKFKFTGVPTWCWVYEKGESIKCLVIGYTKRGLYAFCVGDGGNTDMGNINYDDHVQPLTDEELAENGLRNIK